MNCVAEVAQAYGKEIGKPFWVIGEDGGKAKIKFDFDKGIKRFDGTYWNDAGYFLEYLLTDRIKLIEEVKEIVLFEEI